MEPETQKEPNVHPDIELTRLVSGEVRELICDEIPAYWYCWLELQRRAA